MTKNLYKTNIFEIFSAVFVYFVTVGFALETYSYKTFKLSKLASYIQRFNIIFFIFKKIVKFIKLVLYKLLGLIVPFLLNTIFKFAKSFGIFNFLKKNINFNIKDLFREIFKQIISYKIFGIKIGFRLFLILRVIYLLCLAFIRTLRLTHTLYTWLFIKYLVKRHWIKGESILIKIPHFVSHHFILQFLIDFFFMTLDNLATIMRKKKLVRGYLTYFFSYLFFIHFIINFFCILNSLNGRYVKNLIIFSEAVTLQLGNSPISTNTNAPQIPNKYKISDNDLIDPKFDKTKNNTN